MSDETSNNGDNAAPPDFDLTCWYVNARRLIELVGANNVAPHIRHVGAISDIDDGLRASFILSALKDSLTSWLHSASPPTLGQLLTESKLQPGVLFTHYDRYFFKGLSQVHEALQEGKSPVPMAEAYAKLDSFNPGQKIRFRFHHEHLTSKSSWSELSGQRRLLILGAATEIKKDEIEAIPWVMADPMPHLFGPASITGKHWNERLEVHIDSIDNFERVRDVRPSRSKTALEQLRETPEEEIKKAFAEIIGEQTVPKDWGGEKSDLFSSWVKLRGERISTAFAFKGPAKFHPMTMADLGKNGDQINRLFSEPADLLVLQHCHEITPPVRDTMRAFAQRMGDPRLFCLINGHDTLRLLKAYGKCGFRATTKRSSV